MVEHRPWLTFLTHATLLLGMVIIVFPIYVTFVASTHTLEEIATRLSPAAREPPGGELPQGPQSRPQGCGNHGGPDDAQQPDHGPRHHFRKNHHFSSRRLCHRLFSVSISPLLFLAHLHHPHAACEVAHSPTYKVAADLKLSQFLHRTHPAAHRLGDGYFLFRQFFMTVPDELCEAVRIDGGGPIRFFFDILLPMSRTSIAALFVILFIYGWNQYLWPLLHHEPGELLHGADRHQAHARRGRRAGGVAHHHGLHHAGDDPAGPRGHLHAETVYPGMTETEK